MPGGPAPSTRKDNAHRAEDAAVIFDLRLRRVPYRDIEIITAAPDGPTGGRRFGRSQACKIVKEEMERRIDPLVDEWRALQLDGYDHVIRDHWRLRDAYWDRAVGANDKTPEVAAAVVVDRALTGVTKAIDGQNKILGLETIKYDITSTEVTQQDLELQEMVAELKAKNAVIAAALRTERQAGSD